ncbi:hypothetical protein, partial [Siminovitchia fortis]|uniref:hypothetical protein n=1 Tax=Siminovitchia fortis TaxID=254758 RepID=UPI001C92C66D
MKPEIRVLMLFWFVWCNIIVWGELHGSALGMFVIAFKKGRGVVMERNIANLPGRGELPLFG